MVRSVLAACSICFLKTINYIEVQLYLFGINGLLKVTVKFTISRAVADEAITYCLSELKCSARQSL